MVMSIKLQFKMPFAVHYLVVFEINVFVFKSANIE